MENRLETRIDKELLSAPSVNRPILFNCLPNFVDIEPDQVSEFFVGKLSLCLHLSDPAQRRPAFFIEQGFEEALSVY